MGGMDDMDGMDDMQQQASEHAGKAKGARRQASGQAGQDMRRPGREASERSAGSPDEQARRGQEQGRRRMGDESLDEPQDDWS